MRGTFSLFRQTVLALGCLALALPLHGQDQEEAVPRSGSGRTNGVISGYIQENKFIPVKDFSSATVKIDNKQVVIDGYWEFKDDTGRVLDDPIILSQPPEVNDRLILALRTPGRSIISVTEGGTTKEYQIVVQSRVKQAEAEKAIEEAIKEFVGDPGLQVRVLPPQSTIVGNNFTNAFGEEAVANAFAPSTSTGTGTAASSAAGRGLVSAEDFRPTIVMDGEVQNDIVRNKALAIAYAYSPNVLDTISVKQPLQVRLHVQILAVTQTNGSEAGFQWRTSADDDRLRLRFALSNFTSQAPFNLSLPTDFPPNNASAPNSSLQVESNSLQATLNLMKQEGLVEILQEPVLTVLSGQAAEVVVGQEFPIITTTVNDGVFTQTVEYRPVGVILRINPFADEESGYRPAVDGGGIPWQTRHIYERNQSDEVPVPRMPVNTVYKNGYIRLAIQPVVSSIDLANQINGFPVITLSRIETRVALKHNESLVLGGLFSDDMNKSLEAIPFVEKIPVLGELFKNRASDNSKRELVFVLTPEVIGLGDETRFEDKEPRLARVGERLEELGVRQPKAKPTRVSAEEFWVRPPEASPAPETITPPSENSKTKEETVQPVEEGSESGKNGEAENSDQMGGKLKFSETSSNEKITPRTEETDSGN